MLDKNKYASVDLGVDNLATVIFDRGETAIYSGKILKSVNQYTNKTIAKYKSELEIKNNKNKK